MILKHIKTCLALPLAVFGGWGLSLAATVTFVFVGYIVSASNGNQAGLETGDFITLVGSYDDSVLVDGSGTVSFDAGSGNTFTIATDDSTYTQDGAVGGQAGSYPALSLRSMTFSDGELQGVEFNDENNDWTNFFFPDGGYFSVYNDGSGNAISAWGGDVSPPFNGLIPGEFSVSPTGAATYSIPIEVPPGIGGMQPLLSLNYSSQAGNGLLGLGWSLGGLSAVTRCPATLTQDSLLDPIDFDANDRLCLDGQRLIQVSGAGCGSGTEYRTEIDAYARICAYGSQGSGPTWLKVWTKAGQIMEYGVTNDARIEAQGRSDVLVWALGKVSDTVGNDLTVTYYENNAGGEYYPLRIEYTGTLDRSPYFYVQFTYEQRPDPVSGWVTGSLVRGRVRMTNVQVYAGADSVRDYQLAYDTESAAARSILRGVTLCAGSGTAAACTRATSFRSLEGYQFVQPVYTGMSNSGNQYLEQYAQPMDINGDGKTDVAFCRTPTSRWEIVISDGAGFSKPLDTGIICTTAREYALQIDYDTDGRMDLLVPYSDVWRVLRSTGTGFSLINTGMPSNGRDARPVVMDVNGDGRQDLVLNYSGQWVIRINNGNGFNTPILTGISNVNALYRQAIDYDGDGRMDLLVPYANSRWYALRSTGGGFQLIDTGRSNVGYNKQPQVVDVNGDGYQDLVVNASGGRVVYINRGGSLQNASTWASGAQWADKTWPLNYNGDGRMDLIMPGHPASSTATTWHVLESTGTGFTVINTGIASTGYDKYPLSGDYDGDGFTDMVLVYGYNWKLFRRGSRSIPYLITSIYDYSELIQIDYQPLTDTAVYTKGATAAYPQLSIQTPLYVVSSTTADNGVGGTNVQNYSYEDARVDLHGRGFLGFAKVTVVDETSQIRTLTTYNQSFPYIGLVTSVDTRRVNAGAPLKTLTNAWSNVQPYSGVRQVRAGASTERTYELNGALVSTVTTTPSQYDGYGNPNQVVVTSTGGGATHTKTTTNTYLNDTAQWHLGRLMRSSVTSTTPAGVETRTSAFEYDPNTGLLTAEVIEPDDPELMLRTEYGYDGYGNKTSVSVRDSGSNAYPIATATSTVNYDYSALAGAGTYSVISTNAKGHTETQVIDARYGRPSSLTGPNGFTTQWQYDGFGRQIQETRADGTWTRTRYSGGCCLENALYRVTTQTSGSMPVGVYFDRFDREVRRESVILDGHVVFQDMQYDALGRTARMSRPYMANATPHWTDYAYDALGRVWKETAPDGGIVETTYNGLSTAIRRYAVNGGYDQSFTRITDVEGNLIQVVDEGNQITRYAYDPFGNLARVTDPDNNVTVMAYDRRGRKTGMDDPDMGHWEYHYDALGQLRRQQDAKNQVVTMNYDVLGRVIQRVQPEGTDTWIYDTRPRGIGKLSQINAADGYVERQLYDALGRPRLVQRVIEGAILLIATAYDAQGRVSRTTYPSGTVIRYEYNPQGHLYRLVNHIVTSEVYWTAQDMDAEGHITQELLGNGLQTVRTFDPQSGHLTYLGTYAGPTNVQMLNYRYDSLGNLKSREDAANGLSETFQYDAFNRLTHANIAGAGIKTWSYDGLGNITGKDGYTDYAYGSAGSKPHAVTAARGSTYTYDANGNLQSGGGRTLTWNSANLPTRIVKGGATAEFSYGPDRSRYKQVSVSGGVTTKILYLGGQYEQVTRDGVTTHKDYLSAYGRVVAIRETVNGAATTKYLHQDHLGSTDVITNSTGQVLERQSFDAFGTRRVAADWRDPAAWVSSAFSTRGFTGHEQLDGVGLIHMNGRVYDPQLGRFLSADPVVQYPAGAQGLNRYSYTDNNPLSRVDPSGYGWWSKVWKSVKNVVSKIFDNDIVRAVVGIALGALTYGALNGLWLPFGQITAGFTGGFVGGFIVSGGDLRAGLYGGVSGSIFAGVANFAQGMGFEAGSFGRIGLHALGGGVSSRIQDGDIRDGFLSAGFGQAFMPAVGMIRGKDMAAVIGRTVASVVIGGTASELGGGRFANGARTFGFLRLFGEAASYAARETDRLKQLACSSGGNACVYDERGVLRTDGARDIDYSLNRNESGNWLTNAGMEFEGSGLHVYENNTLARYFITDVSKIHDWFNSWNYSSSSGFYMSRGVTFDSVFQIYSFAGMPVAGLATVAGYAGNVPFDQQMMYYNIVRNSR